MCHQYLLYIVPLFLFYVLPIKSSRIHNWHAQTLILAQFLVPSTTTHQHINTRKQQAHEIQGFSGATNYYLLSFGLRRLAAIAFGTRNERREWQRQEIWKVERMWRERHWGECPKQCCCCQMVVRQAGKKQTDTHTHRANYWLLFYVMDFMYSTHNIRTYYVCMSIKEEYDSVRSAGINNPIPCILMRFFFLLLFCQRRPLLPFHIRVHMYRCGRVCSGVATAYTSMYGAQKIINLANEMKV